jgi:hypothetical protein
MQLFKKQNWLAVTIALALVSCAKNPTSPNANTPAQNDKFARMATATSAEVYRSVQTFAQIEQALDGPAALGKINVPAVGSLQKSGTTFKQALIPFQQEASALAQQAGRLHKTQGDTILYEKRWIDPRTGINYHLLLSYNTTSGKAAVSTVATNHPSSSPLERDSTRIVVNVNFTLANTTDDVVELLENAKTFRRGYRLRYEEGRLVPDKYQPGSQPTGGVIEALSQYASGQDTTEVRQRLEYHETTGGLGSFSKIVNFRDGTRHSEDLTFRSTQIIFNIAYRDGTREQGQFTAPDENHLAFEKTVTYPAGSDPRSIFEKGNFSKNPVDSSGAANFTREEFFANGTSKRHEVKIKASRQNGYGRLEVTESFSDGTSGSWTLQEGPAKTDLQGNWINAEKQYILLDAAFYRGGGADMHIEVYASKEAHDKGEPPIFEADLHFRPDGSGSGTITSKEGTSQFSFSANGTPRS